MAWFLLIIVLIAAAFGVLGAVLKVTAVLVLTIVLTIVIVGVIAWFAFKRWLARTQGVEVKRVTNTADGVTDARGWIRPGETDPELPKGDPKEAP